MANCIYCGDPALVKKHQLEDDALVRVASDAADLLSEVRRYILANGAPKGTPSSAVTTSMRNLSNSLEAFKDIGTNHEMVRVTVARLLRLEDELDSD